MKPSKREKLEAILRTLDETSASLAEAQSRLSAFIKERKHEKELEDKEPK